MSIPLENQLNTILSPIFGDEIYPIVHPDPDGTVSSVSNIYAIFMVIGGVSFNSLTGDTSTSRPRVQISIYATDYTEIKTAQTSVAQAMLAANVIAGQCVDTQTDQFQVAGALANVSATVPHEGFDAETKRFYVHCEFYCWNDESIEVSTDAETIVV